MTLEDGITAQFEILNEVVKELQLHEAGASNDLELLAEEAFGIHHEDITLESESTAEKKADVISKLVVDKTSKSISKLANSVKQYVIDGKDMLEYKYVSSDITLKKSGHCDNYRNKRLSVLVDYSADLTKPMTIPKTISTVVATLVEQNEFFTKSSHVYAQLAAASFSKIKSDKATVRYVKDHISSFHDRTRTPMIAQSNIYGDEHKLLTFTNVKYMFGSLSMVKWDSSSYETSARSFTGEVDKKELEELIEWSKKFESEYASLKKRLYKHWNEDANIFIDALKILGKWLADRVMFIAGTSAASLTTLMGLAGGNPIIAFIGGAFTGMSLVHLIASIVKFFTFIWFLIRTGHQYIRGIINDLSKTGMVIDKYVKDIT